MDKNIEPLSELIDRILADPIAHEEARRRLVGLHESRPSNAAGVGPPATPDRWTRRARPTFLYVMYALLLWSIPVGLVAAIRPAVAEAIARGMTAYLAGLPEPLYALFGTGYVGYTVARQWGKVTGVER